jgi:hypothetical protein
MYLEEVIKYEEFVSTDGGKKGRSGPISASGGFNR